MFVHDSMLCSAVICCACCGCCFPVQGTAAVMNVGDEDVMSGFATLLPGAEGADEDAAAGEYIETDSGLTSGLQERGAHGVLSWWYDSPISRNMQQQHGFPVVSRLVLTRQLAAPPTMPRSSTSTLLTCPPFLCSSPCLPPCSLR